MAVLLADEAEVGWAALLTRGLDSATFLLRFGRHRVHPQEMPTQLGLNRAVPTPHRKPLHAVSERYAEQFRNATARHLVGEFRWSRRLRVRHERSECTEQRRSSVPFGKYNCRKLESPSWSLRRLVRDLKAARAPVCNRR